MLHFPHEAARLTSSVCVHARFYNTAAAAAVFMWGDVSFSPAATRDPCGPCGMVVHEGDTAVVVSRGGQCSAGSLVVRLSPLVAFIR